MSRSPLLEYVNRERDRYVEEWCASCRFASVSAEGHADLYRLADWLTDRALSVLDRVEQIPLDDHAPVLLGELDGEGRSRLLLYSHYDVQPAGAASEWLVPPFAADVRDDALIARGCCDDKSDVMARLHAIEAFSAVHGRPSFSIAWLTEGAEEIGSPGLAGVIDANRERLTADGCLWESYLRREDGRPEIAFGCRGLLYVELRHRVLDADRHAVFSSVYRSAAVELTHALASLVDDRYRVAIDGFYDDLLELDGRILESSDAPAPGVGCDPSLLIDPDPGEYARRLLFEPSLTIAGLEAGYTGPGIKTIVAAEARAKLDIRLLPNQNPEAVLAKLREHLARRGFAEIEVVPLTMTAPAASRPDSALARAAVDAARDVLGAPVCYPVAGSGPIRLFTDRLDVSVVMPAGTTRPDGAIHAPNERARIEDYLDHVRFTARLLERIHEQGGLVE